MKQKWWLVPVALAVIGLLWILTTDNVDLAPLQSAIGLKSASVERAKSKPICSSPVNPNVAAPTDCIPQHLAKLPPHPGKAGENQFIDMDKDGVRDDVQIFIETKYGHSRRAVAALRQIAGDYQYEIAMSGKVTREEAHEYTQKVSAKIASCYINSVPEEIINDGAAERVGVEVTNTPERHKAAKRFQGLLHGMVTNLDTSPLVEQCGYDPAMLPD